MSFAGRKKNIKQKETQTRRQQAKHSKTISKQRKHVLLLSTAGREGKHFSENTGPPGSWTSIFTFDHLTLSLPCRGWLELPGNTVGFDRVNSQKEANKQGQPGLFQGSWLIYNKQEVMSKLNKEISVKNWIWRWKQGYMAYTGVPCSVLRQSCRWIWPIDNCCIIILLTVAKNLSFFKLKMDGISLARNPSPTQNPTQMGKKKSAILDPHLSHFTPKSNSNHHLPRSPFRPLLLPLEITFCRWIGSETTNPWHLFWYIVVVTFKKWWGRLMVGGMCLGFKGGKLNQTVNGQFGWRISVYHDSDYQVIQHDILNPV